MPAAMTWRVPPSTTMRCRGRLTARPVPYSRKLRSTVSITSSIPTRAATSASRRKRATAKSVAQRSRRPPREGPPPGRPGGRPGPAGGRPHNAARYGGGGGPPRGRLPAPAPAPPRGGPPPPGPPGPRRRPPASCPTRPGRPGRAPSPSGPECSPGRRRPPTRRGPAPRPPRPPGSGPRPRAGSPGPAAAGWAGPPGAPPHAARRAREIARHPAARRRAEGLKRRRHQPQGDEDEGQPDHQDEEPAVGSPPRGSQEKHREAEPASCPRREPADRPPPLTGVAEPGQPEGNAHAAHLLRWWSHPLGRGPHVTEVTARTASP